MATTEQILNISNYTNKDRFNNLIASIDNDIKSKSTANLLINSQTIGISGSTIDASSKSNFSSNALNNIANTISSSAAGVTSSISSGLSNIAGNIGLSTDAGKPTVVNLSAMGPLNTDNFNAKSITKYLPPSNIALSAFDKLGKDIDGLIKDTFLVTMFHLKGTDILCTTLCLLMSLIPCKISNMIVDDIQKIKDIQSQVVSAAQSAIAAEKFALNSINSGLSGGVTGLANIKDINKSLKTAFSTNTGSSKTSVESVIQEVKSITTQLATVVNVLNLLISAVNLGWQNPQAILGFLVNGMFDILENVLTALQAIAVQMADKIMNKVIAPIEKYFNSNTFPSLCGLGAQILFKKILAIIYEFKKKLLKFIADLFAFQKGTRKKFTLFNSNMQWTLELSALLKVLNLLLGNFVDIAIACGVGRRPCPDNTDNGVNLSQTFNTAASMSENGVNNNIYMNQIPTSVVSNVTAPPPGVLNQLATKLQPMIDSIFPGSNSQVTSGQVRTELTNLPPLIASFLGSIDLGANTTIYQNNNNATIVYNNSALCGS